MISNREVQTPLISLPVDSGQPLRVLLVEDDQQYAIYMQEFLRVAPGLNVEVTHVASLARAEAALARAATDLVVLDVMLPDGNGCHWLATQKELGQTAAVVVLSNVEGDEAVTAALSAGAEDYLVKSDSDPSTLLRVVRHAVERHYFREQLNRTGRRFQHLLENVVDLITVLDLDGSVVYASPAAERLLGVKPEKLIGSRLWDRVHVDDVMAMHALILQLAEEPETPRECEFRVLGTGDIWHSFEAIGRVLTDAPRQQILINARDVSARKKAEQALQQREQDLRKAQKMEAIGRLAGGVAHDFSNVLTVILGATERLLDQLPSERPLRAEAESIRHAAERAVDLTMQLLTFSRRQVMAPTVLPVADVLAGVGRFLRPLIGEDIAFTTTIQPGIGSIRADRTQLEQVLLNLAINARDAMPNGGKLAIDATTTTLVGPESIGGVLLPPGPYILIRVEDTGVGMDERTLARAFEPFFTTKGPDKGTGIGLATVYGIVNQSGGAVALSSRIDVGTTVSAYFPQVAEPLVEPTHAPVQPPAAPAGGTETVLLVEDEDEVRELVRDMLELAGYTVLAAELPHVADRFCRTHDGPIHLLLTDVVMPEASGRDVATRVREVRPDTRILFMSGYPEYPGSASEVSALEGEYLAKPFDRRVLLARVRGVLDAKAPVRTDGS
jgi:two-component system cell cycle sensor histidine kinase/response regulator CckA